MALFNVEGWSIKTKTVAFDNKTNKSSKDKKIREKMANLQENRS